MRTSQQESPHRPGSRGLQLLGLAIVLGGIVIIFAGQFEVLPRSALTSGIGGGMVGLGLWVNLRFRQPKPEARFS